MDITAVLLSSDQGLPVSAIAEQHHLPMWKVYRILQVYRPRSLYPVKRERKGRGKTSEKRPQIESLLRDGIGPAAIAAGLEVSRAYVYKVRGELK